MLGAVIAPSGKHSQREGLHVYESRMEANLEFGRVSREEIIAA
jgi:hypothetical protein